MRSRADTAWAVIPVSAAGSPEWPERERERETGAPWAFRPQGGGRGFGMLREMRVCLSGKLVIKLRTKRFSFSFSLRLFNTPCALARPYTIATYSEENRKKCKEADEVRQLFESGAVHKVETCADFVKLEN